MNEAELTAIEEQCAKATKGPWDYDEIATPFYNDAEGDSRGGLGTGFYEVFTAVMVEDDGEPYEDTIVLVERATKADAIFIAAARTDIPLLVAEVRRLEFALYEATNELTELRDEVDRARKERIKNDTLLLEQSSGIQRLQAEVRRLRAFVQPIADHIACTNPVCGHRRCEQTRQARTALQEEVPHDHR